MADQTAPSNSPHHQSACAPVSQDVASSHAPVILPRTSFAMRGNLPAQEPEILAFWNSHDLYDTLQTQRRQQPMFVLHDGPPYANGPIHMGHALNKILKDFVVRGQAMRGRNVSWTPGWDCHGLPIETQIEKQLLQNKQNRHSLSVPEFRQQCREFAARWIQVQSQGFQRLGAMADWKNPYTTMDFSFQANIVQAFFTLMGQGYVYRGLRPVLWSAQEQTALAEAEVEYQDITSTALHVGFPITRAVVRAQDVWAASVHNDTIHNHHKPIDTTHEFSATKKPDNLESKDVWPKEQAWQEASQDPVWTQQAQALQTVLDQKIQEHQVHAIIWTTTPWSLPGNRGISVQEQGLYGLYHVQPLARGASDHTVLSPQQNPHAPNPHSTPDNSTNHKHNKSDDNSTAIETLQATPVASWVVVATALWPEVRQQLGLHDSLCVACFPGTQLCDWMAAHPWVNLGYDFPVPFVPSEFVTTQAGTGLVHTAPCHGLEDFIVGTRHKLPCAMPLSAEGVFHDNVPGLAGQSMHNTALIIQLLKDHGVLWHQAPYQHSYPHSWRSKKPLFYRATPQWFIALDGPLGLRDKALTALEDVHFYPESGRARMISTLQRRPDWCLSRQRVWGVPIATFLHRHTDQVLYDPAVNARIVQRIHHEGSDFWFTDDAFSVLHDLPDITCHPLPGQQRPSYDPTQWIKNTDIIDVWFESGVTHQSVLAAPPMPSSSSSDNNIASQKPSADPADEDVGPVPQDLFSSLQADSSTGLYKRAEDCSVGHWTEPCDFLSAGATNKPSAGSSKEIGSLGTCGEPYAQEGSLGVQDTLDRSTSHTEHHSPGRWPADVYLEGSDQHRAWFQSSLTTAIALHGRPPYKTLVTHGFLLDHKGHKMSKSQGNVVDPDAIVRTKGADILRLWVAYEDAQHDVRIGTDILARVEDMYRRLRNTFRYLLGALDGFTVDQWCDPTNMAPLHRWVHHQLVILDQAVATDMAAFDFRKMVDRVHHFCAQDLSAFYFSACKDSLYCDASAARTRQEIRTTMWHTLISLMHWLAPIIPFTTEQVWQCLRRDCAADKKDPQIVTTSLPSATHQPSPTKTIDTATAFNNKENAVLEALWQKTFAIFSSKHTNDSVDQQKAFHTRSTTSVLGADNIAEKKMYVAHQQNDEDTLLPQQNAHHQNISLSFMDTACLPVAPDFSTASLINQSLQKSKSCTMACGTDDNSWCMRDRPPISIHLSTWKQWPENWLDDRACAFINACRNVKTAITAALEKAKQDKVVHDSLTACAHVHVPSALLQDGIDHVGELLAQLAGVSYVTVQPEPSYTGVEGTGQERLGPDGLGHKENGRPYPQPSPGDHHPQNDDCVRSNDDASLFIPTATIALAAGIKCGRCWRILVEVDPNIRLCKRCAHVSGASV